MQIESAEQAKEYIDLHGEAAVREKIAAGAIGSEKRALAYLNAEFARRGGGQAIHAATQAAERAARHSATAALWTMVAGFAALVATSLQLLQLAVPMQRSSWEQMAQCRIDVNRDLPNATSGDKTEQGIVRGEYLQDCMQASGFAFQSDIGQSCQTQDELHRSAKQILPSCYSRRSVASRVRTSWEGS